LLTTVSAYRGVAVPISTIANASLYKSNWSLLVVIASSAANDVGQVTAASRCRRRSASASSSAVNPWELGAAVVCPIADGGLAWALL
jgi:hypothetical protein